MPDRSVECTSPPDGAASTAPGAPLTPSSTEVRILEGALELFATRGFKGTGIREVARACGLTPATLYHYMGTKEDLLVALMKSGLCELIEDAECALADCSGAIVHLERLIAIHVFYHGRNSSKALVIDTEVRSLTGMRRQEILQLRDRYESLWDAAIDRGVAEGLFNTPRPGLARLAILEMCNGIAHWFTPLGSLSLDEVAQAHVSMSLALLGCTTQRDLAEVSRETRRRSNKAMPTGSERPAIRVTKQSTPISSRHRKGRLDAKNGNVLP